MQKMKKLDFKNLFLIMIYNFDLFIKIYTYLLEKHKIPSYIDKLRKWKHALIVGFLNINIRTLLCKSTRETQLWWNKFSNTVERCWKIGRSESTADWHLWSAWKTNYISSFFKQKRSTTPTIHLFAISERANGEEEAPEGDHIFHFCWIINPLCLVRTNKSKSKN